MKKRFIKQVSLALSAAMVISVTPLYSLEAEASSPPVVNEVLPDRTVAIGSAPFTVDISNVFRDPDGDPLTLKGISVDPSIATVVQNGNILTITPVSTGTVRIHLTANDGIYTYTSKFFVTVVADTTPPEAATFTADKTYTNQSVKVTINYPLDASVKEYKIGSEGAWTVYTTPVVLSENNTVYARSSDVAGNVSVNSSYTVSNIVVDNGPEIDLTPSLTELTNQSVKVYARIMPVDRVTISTVKWASGNQTVSYFNTSGTLLSVPVDKLTDSLKTLIKNYPDYGYILVGRDSSGDIAFLLSKTPMTYSMNSNNNNSLSVSNGSTGNPVVVLDSTGQTMEESGSSLHDSSGDFLYGNVAYNGLLQDYIGTSFDVAENGTYTVYAKDSLGVETIKTITVSNIDKVAPTAPKGSLANGNVVTITPGTDDVAVDSTWYQLNGGQWTKHDGNPLMLVDGAFTLNMKSVDKAGNVSEIATFEFTVTVDLEKAKTVVTRAENTPSWSLVNAARTGLQKVAPSIEKDALQNRLDKVVADLTLFDSITSEIERMDGSINQGKASLVDIRGYKVSVNELRGSVDTLPNTMSKASLHTQLDGLEKKLNLIETVLKTNDNGGVTGIDLGGLQDQINELPEGELKDQLQDQLDQAKDLQKVIDKVKQAEQSKSQSDVDNARNAVKNLSNGQTKDDLNSRLDAVQDEINNSNNTSDPYKNVESIKDPVVKATLSDAQRYVELAEKYKTKTWIVTALNKVDAITDAVKTNPLYSIVVNDLTSRANKLKEEYNNGITEQELQQKISVATNYVSQYEKFKTSYYKARAQAAVDALSDGEVKTGLQARINAVLPK